MPIQPYFIIILLFATMALFIWGRWRYDVVALIALMVAVAIGAVPFSKAYTGLSNSAVITVACVMIISKAITRSGVLQKIVDKFSHLAQSTILHISSLTLITATLSAFMNNIGALALMMPIAIQSAIASKRSPSLILMPLAFGSVLGGLITVIGTPPNLLISSYRQKITGHPFAMFDFTYVGLPVALIGIIFIAVLGWRLLPKNRKAPQQTGDMFQIQDYITEVKILESSKVIGMNSDALEASVTTEIVILGFIRNNRKRFVIGADQTFEENDILVVEASPKGIQELLQLGKLELAADKPVSTEVLRSDDIVLMEAVVPQGARIEGSSSKSIRLRSRYNLNLLAIAREGNPFKERLSEVILKPGDVVLMQGLSDSAQERVVNLGLLPLVERDIDVSVRPLYLPVIIFACAIILAAAQLLPVEIAFGGAVLLMVLFNVISIRNIYEHVEWSIIVLLAAMIPIGEALQSTGGTALISQYLLAMSAHLSPVFILVLLIAVTMILTDFMNNAATAVVMAPIAVSIAQALHVNTDTFLMGVAVASSCSFLTPIGHQNNTLVLGPGGYKFSDYIRMGLPLVLIILIVVTPLLLWAWPLYKV